MNIERPGTRLPIPAASIFISRAGLSGVAVDSKRYSIRNGFGKPSALLQAGGLR